MLFSEPKIPQTTDFRRNSVFPADVVSVLFSEPKIPQKQPAFDVHCLPDVSVLFSEPKIPQIRRKL